MFKRILTVFIALCLAVTPLLGGIPAAFAQDGDNWLNHAATGFSGGSGKAGDPYLIASAEELARLASLSVEKDLAGMHFALTSDIDLSGREWTPIRFFGNGESITFDGRGHTVSGLTVREFSRWDRQTNYTYRWQSAGLFSVLEYSTVKNLSLKAPQVTVICDDAEEGWDYYAGALAGSARESVIENCHVSNPEVSMNCNGSGDSSCYVGGMVGDCYSDAMLMGCSVSGGSVSSVSRTEGTFLFTGGLVGHVGNSSFVCNSSANAALDARVLSSLDGSITQHANSYISVGGLIGEARGSFVFNSYSAAKLSVALQNSGRVPIYAEIGGVAGSVGGYLENCYFSGDISLKENLEDNYIDIGKTYGYTSTSNGMLNNYYVYGSSGAPDWWRITTDGEYKNSSYAYHVTTPIEELEGDDKKAALCLALNTYLYQMKESVGFNYYPGDSYWREALSRQPNPPHIASWKIVEGVNDGYPVLMSESEWPFEDVTRADWFFEAVRHVYLRGIVKGVSDTQFAPAQALSRATLVTLLWRLEGEPEPNGASEFSDVERGSWYDKAVSWATEEKIVSGVGGGRFAPADILTREQMATIFFRYAQHKDYIVPDESYSIYRGYKDIDSISDWAFEALEWCNYFDIIGGSNDLRILPQNGSTRAESATVIMRFTEYLYMWRDRLPER